MPLPIAEASGFAAVFGKRAGELMKSQKTLELEQEIWQSTNKLGTFGCFEVTVGWYGKERADYVTYDSNGIWRFYEIKVSKSDFYSNAKHSFYGHYNYFVMPKELYDKVKDDIPDFVGVTDGRYSLKKAKKQELIIESDLLKDYFIRSLQREYAKDRDSRDESKLAYIKRNLECERRNRQSSERRYTELCHAIREKYGVKALRELIFENSNSKGDD